jgi:hypothetical protein
MTKSFKDALSRTSRPIPGVKDSRFPSSSKPGFKQPGSKPGFKPTTATSSKPNLNLSVKSNPFNMKVSKPKFDVLNRNVSGSRGNSVVSRTKAIAVRSATLLPQLQEKNRAHVSSFIDRRFGLKEGGDLSREEVMQERFAREQQRIAKKQSRRNKFNLNSIEDIDEADDETRNFEEFSLTHGGKSIEKMDDDELENYDQDYDGDDQDESYDSRGKSGQLDRDLVSHGHFGSGGDEKKSKSDVMKELIAKSKFYKMERQKIKEENEQLCEDVNEAFAAIRENLQVLGEEDRKQKREEIRSQVVEDDYEATLKELAFDPRSKPSDRTLTPEEREEKEKKRLDEQTKALFERMEGKEATPEEVDQNEEEEGELDPELKRIAEKQFKLMREFCHRGGEEPYIKLVEYATKQPRTMIQLARAIRGDIGKLTAAFTKRSNATGRGALMPTFGPIRLLLLVSRIFSCSDFHHVVATPAQLLLSYYLGVGRMTKLEHVKRALALVYCTTQFQLVGKRCVPEALQVLFTILRTFEEDKKIVDSSSHYFCRPLSKSLVEELKNQGKKSKKMGRVLISSLFDEKESSELGVNEIYRLTCKLVEETFEILRERNYPALKEAARPFALLLPKNEIIMGMLEGNKSLQLQQHKPLALPLLTPDFAADYSMEHRKHGGQDADEQSASRMKRAMKREYKGAVRELKRDAAFLSEHKVRETRKKDTEYKAKMNKIMGSIANGN